jgi:hypothetical protein
VWVAVCSRGVRAKYASAATRVSATTTSIIFVGTEKILA